MAAFARLDAWFDRHREMGPLFIRLVVGARLVYGTWDNVTSWERMEEFAAFLEQFGFPLPLVSAIVSVAVQFVGGLLMLAGGWTRPVAALLSVNFAVALLAVHLPAGDSFLDAYDALVMLAGALFLLVHGPGRLSVDEARSPNTRDLQT